MINKLKKILYKAFVGGFWMVGLRDKKNLSSLFLSIDANPGQWLADPFLYEYEGRHYLFVEQYLNKHNKGAIGVYEVVNGKSVNNNIIIEEQYHLSYPCVFYYQGCHWVIPESSANHSLDIYKATEFPYKWERVATLLNNCRIVDTTVHIKGDDLYLLCYEKSDNGWNLNIYILNLNEFTLSVVATKHYKINNGRPAGRLFDKDGHLYRPAQNGSSKYGESILIYEITDLTKNSYAENFAYEMKANDINLNKRFNRIHTYNMDSRYEVIDAFQEHLDLFCWWKILKRHYLKR